LKQLGSIVRRVLTLSVALVALIYLGDYLVVRLRDVYPRLGKAFDSLQMARVYAIPLKNGSVEYELDAVHPEVTVTCVHALFPHLGYQPCWYVRRQSQKPIPMVILVTASVGGWIERRVACRMEPPKETER
jgi:hypothetical protein